MRPGSLRSVPIAAPSVQGKPCKARNGRWTGRPHRESPRASVSASPVIIYYNACLKTQSDRLLVFRFVEPGAYPSSCPALGRSARLDAMTVQHAVDGDVVRNVSTIMRQPEW